MANEVAPVRERGLKYKHRNYWHTRRGRSRKGAWIEIEQNGWRVCHQDVAPVRERGLKSDGTQTNAYPMIVAPVRERGLKLAFVQNLAMTRVSLP